MQLVGGPTPTTYRPIFMPALRRGLGICGKVGKSAQDFLIFRIRIGITKINRLPAPIVS